MLRAARVISCSVSRRSCGAGESLLKSVVSAFLHDPVGVADRAAQVLERLRALGHPLRVDAVDERVRVLERRVERRERRPHVAADRVERHLVDLGEDAAELRLDAREASRHHRQLQRILRPVDLHLRRVREVLERDVELAGEEAAGAKLRPQPLVLDDAAQDAHPLFRRHFRHRLAGASPLPGRQGGDEAFREERDDHARTEDRRLRVVREAHVGDLADLQAEERHRRARRQATNRLVEIEHVAALDRIRLLHRDAAVAIQRELAIWPGPAWRRRSRTRARRRPPRPRAAPRSIRCERCMPSAPSVMLTPLTFQKRVLGRDVLVVRRVDEDRDVDRLAVGSERVAGHLAHVEAPVVDRRADAERAQRRGLQHELPPRLVRDDRRLVEREEQRLALARLARLEADVVAGEQRAQSGHAAQRDPRLDDPELRVRDHEARRVLRDLRLDQHLGVVLGELHRRHEADPHVLVADERLAGLDALAPPSSRW